jgi:hypothetical protein
VLTELGLTVTRSIPFEQLGGLLSGAYSLHGGVIRDGAGRIVSHLVSSGAPNALASLVPGLNTLSSVVANGQLYSLGRDVAAIQSTVSTVLNVASVGAVLSGLGLVTSIAGFAYQHKRLNVIDKQLAELLDVVKDIKQTLMYQQFANLRAAVKLMQHAERADDHEVRRGKLLQANETFTKLIFFYADVWGESKDVRQLSFLEDCYTLAYTGASLTNSSMGLYDVAAKEYAEHYQTWQSISRKHIKAQLLNENPQRLLNGVSAKVLPTRQLVELLDFANDTNKGMDWVDELRKVPTVFDVPWRETVSPPTIKFANNLCARNGVLQASEEHFKFLEAKRISVIDFSLAAENERHKLDAPAVCISALPLAA